MSISFKLPETLLQKVDKTLWERRDGFAQRNLSGQPFGNRWRLECWELKHEAFEDGWPGLSKKQVGKAQEEKKEQGNDRNRAKLNGLVWSWDTLLLRFR